MTTSGQALGLRAAMRLRFSERMPPGRRICIGWLPRSSPKKSTRTDR